MAFRSLLGVVLVVLALTSCQRLGLTKQYEYDERVELSLDGSAVVDINASIPALVALRGETLSVDPQARLDRQVVRRLYEGEGVRVREVSAYRRHGRRFVHVRLEVARLIDLPRLRPLAWSSYRFDRTGGEFRFLQEVGTAARLSVGEVGWAGDELVAFRLHLPSHINFHNSPIGIERGNILVWEQTLRDRVASRPLRMEARMETESILYRTLWLFIGTFVAAMAVLAVIVWRVSRKGRSAVPA